MRRIADGRVRVDGRLVRNPSFRVELGRARLELDGEPVRERRTSLVLALHKPAGHVTTRVDPGGRPTVYDLIPQLDRFVFPVGRLDRDTRGLLILTDDHRLGQRLTDPLHHVAKTYHAHVAGVPAEDALEVLRRGITLPDDGTPTRPARVRSLGVAKDGGAWVEIVLTEGRNRQVRRMCAAIGHDVRDLVRVAIGSLDLGDLPAGEWRRLAPDEVARLG
jgi:23S rRNA pseudouridine2605 synthase